MSSPPSVAGADRLAMVGREAERAVLLDALHRAGTGQGAAVAVVGAAGVGKSRLSRELLAAGRAARVPVLVGRSVANASAVPYRAIRESLLSWSRGNDLPSPEGLGEHGRAVHHLLDERDPDGQPISPVFVAEAYLRVLAAIGGDTGCVVVLEDLHWADDETLAVVEYLADHAASTCVLALLTSRNDEPAPARPLLDALGARGSVQILRLPTLGRAQVAELATGLLGGPVSPGLVELLHERSEGVPLLVEELVAALQESHGLVTGPQGTEAAEAAAVVLPASVADAVRVRLGALPSQERQVLETAAVFGRAFDWRRLPPLAGLDEGVVLQALRAATDGNLVEADPVRPGELRFRHALIRDAVAAATFPPQRSLLARRALDELMTEVAGEDAEDEQLALAIGVATQADDREAAARLAIRLAWRANNRWSLATAERRLSEARRYAGTDPALLVEIDVLQLRVASAVGRLDVVRAIGGALLTRIGEEDPESRLETLLRLGQVEAEDGSWEQSRRQLAAARPLLGRTTDHCHHTRLEVWSAVADIAAGSPDTARRHAVRAIELAEAYDDEVDLVCASLVHLGRLAMPDLVEARAHWQRGLHIATDHGLRLWRGRLLTELGGAALADLHGDEELEEALALAGEAGALELAQRVGLLRAELALLRARTDEAAEHLDDAEGAAGRTEVVSPTRDRALALRGLLAALRRGELPAGAPATVRALAALAEDDLPSARSIAEVADQRPAAPLRPYRALLDLLADPAPHPEGTPLPGVLGAGLSSAQRAAGDARRGETASAAALLAEAAAALRDAPLLGALVVRLLTPAVAAATDAGHEEQAAVRDQLRDQLREAAATFDRLDLARPADACRALLRDLGVAVPRRPSAQAGVPERLRALGVTGRELDVLQLVAEGLTSKDIGDRLYLSHRTVEKHVERLLAKTGAANRTALAALAAESSGETAGENAT